MVGNVYPFWRCFKVMPLVYDESLSYYDYFIIILIITHSHVLSMMDLILQQICMTQKISHVTSMIFTLKNI